MTERWKKDDPQHLQPSFFSHKQGDGWCSGKPAKVGGNSAQLDRIESKLGTVIEMLDSLGGRTRPEPSKNTKPLPF